LGKEKTAGHGEVQVAEDGLDVAARVFCTNTEEFFRAT
jgi:hypothetical protein